MLLRVETSLTLHTKSDHFIKHTTVLEMDHADIVRIVTGYDLDSVIVTQSPEDLAKKAFEKANELTMGAVWQAVEEQLEGLEE